MNEFAAFCDRILVPTINGLYQGIILVTFVAVLLRMMKRTNASTRHAIWFFTLALLVAILGIHWARVDGQSGRKQQISPPASFNKANSSHPDQLTMVETMFSLDTGSEVSARITEDLQRPDSQGNLGNSEMEGFPASGSDSPSDATIFASTANSWMNPVTLAMKLPRGLAAIIAILCMAIAAVRIGIFGLRLREVFRLKAESDSPGRQTQDFFQELCQKMGTRRKVELRVSRSYNSPVFLGGMRPVILLPVALDHERNHGELRHILLHELAHARRFDDWTNFLQQLVQTLLFFHPGIQWTATQLSLAREIACDDYAVERSDRRAYALLLVDLARQTQGNGHALAPGTFGKKNQLKKRINMVLENHKNSSPCLGKTRTGLVITAITILAAVGTLYAPRVILAQNDRIQQEPGRPEDVVAPRPPLGGVPRIAGPLPATPVPPMPPPAMSPRDRPLEQRLARVERMLEMLVARLDARRGMMGLSERNGPEQEAMQEKMMMEQRRHIDAEKKFRDYTESQERNDEFRKGEKTLKEEMERSARLNPKERIQMQLQTLQKRLEMLEREKEKLGHEMERLQHHQEKLDREADQQSDKK